MVLGVLLQISFTIYLLDLFWFVTPMESSHFVFIKLEPMEHGQVDVKPEYEVDPSGDNSEEPRLVEACPFEVICKIEEHSTDEPTRDRATKLVDPVATASSRLADKLNTDTLSKTNPPTGRSHPENYEQTKAVEFNLLHINTIDEKPFSCDQCKKKYSQQNYLNRHIMRQHSGLKPHECKECNKRFVSKAEVRSHSRTHTGERPFSCLRCGRAFSHRAHLKAHIRSHTGERPYKCDECDKSYTDKKTLKMHKEKHKGERPYRCTICEKTFSWPCNLRNHVKTHLKIQPKIRAGAVPGGGGKSFSCDDCGRSFARKCTLKHHLVTHASQMPFVCETCGRGFARSCSLNLHAKTHTELEPFVCAECGKGFSLMARLKKHEQVHVRRNVAASDSIVDECGSQLILVEACPVEVICKIEEYSIDEPTGHTATEPGESMGTASSRLADKLNTDTLSGTNPSTGISHLENSEHTKAEECNLLHINRTHKKIFSCDQCPKKYNQQNYLNRHIRREHSGIKPHECEECSKRFVTKTELRSHSRTHTGERPFPCLECGRAFTHKDHLDAHICTNTGKRPYKCDDCEKTYSVKKSLEIHKVEHTGQRLHRCTVCEKAFILPHNLRNHMKIHAGAVPGGGGKSFGCDDCGRSFARKSTLQNHLVTHASQMPFACEQCGRGFARSCSLDLHVKTHAEVKPFVCAECGKRFPLIGRLKKHEQVHLRSKVAASDIILDRCRTQLT